MTETQIWLEAVGCGLTASGLTALICYVAAAAVRWRKKRTRGPLPRVYQVSPWDEFRRAACTAAGTGSGHEAMRQGDVVDLPGRILRHGKVYTRLPAHGELPTDAEIWEAERLSYVA